MRYEYDNSLTENEKNAIRADMAKLYSNPDYAKTKAEDRIWDLAYKVRDFANGTDHAMWVGRLIASLTDDCFRLPKIKVSDSIEVVRGSFEVQVAEGLEDAIADFEVSPEFYQNGKPTEETHPWDAKVTKVCRKLLDATPYEVYLLVEEVEESAVETLREELLEMACSRSNGGSVAKASEKAFANIVHRLLRG